MASMRNVQRAQINSSAATITAVANPSASLFMYIWQIALSTNGATNLTFNDGLGQVSGPYYCTANEGIYENPPQAGTPVLIISPGQSFTITNSGSVAIGGHVIWSQ